MVRKAACTARHFVSAELAQIYRRKRKQEETVWFMTRRQELFLTVISNLVLQAASAVCGFVLPPLIVGTFGSEMNGMVSSIAQFIAYLSLVEAGIGAASVAALYKPLAEHTVHKINGILSAARKFYFRSGVIFSAGIIALAFLYPLATGGQVDTATSFLMVLVLGISGSAEFFLIGKYRVLLTADKKLYVISFLQSAATAANTAVAAVLIKCGFGILAVKFSSSVVYLSRFVFLAFYVHRNYREVSFFAEADTKEICQSRNALVHQISGFVVFNSPVIVLTVLCGLKEVSVYSVYALVFSAVNNLVCSFSTGIQSFFGESLAKDSAGRTSRFFSVYETVFFLLAFWLYSCTAVLIMPFMKLYTVRMSDTQYIRPALAALMVLSGILTNIRNPGGQLINAAGHFKQTQFRSLLEAAVNILAGILLTLKFGTIGVVMGNICSSLYRGIDVVIYANRHILSEKSFGSLVKIICIASVFFVLVLLLKKIPFDFSSWEKWIMNAFCVSVLSFLPVFLASVYVKRNQKKERI